MKLGVIVSLVVLIFGAVISREIILISIDALLQI
jgi:hypothetical protein